jgi:GNAT superfamily N-acetyltransferase
LITYLTSPQGLKIDQVQGFFTHWGEAPSPAAFLRILHGSAYVVLAQESVTQQIIGYITAISDGVSSAYIPHLEVHPDWRGQGIGTELVRRMTDQLAHLYMVDLTCDEDLIPFYSRLGFRPYTAMIRRNYDRQRCD